MKRLALAILLALAPFSLSGTAAASVPTHETPNASGSLLLPPAWTTGPTHVQEPSHAELQTLWMQAGGAYGIPWQILGAINKIESNYGRNMGPSSAGAVGWMQFMPETWLRWGMDASGDRVSDPWNPEDAIFSAARYLAAADGQTDIKRAIFAYNHADWYVNDVLEMAALFESGGVDGAFTIDKLQVDLEAAQSTLATGNRKLIRALADERRAERLEQMYLQLAARSDLLSDRLEHERRAGVAGAERAAAAAHAQTLRDELEAAQEALAEAREGANAASFTPGASTMLAAPSYNGDYVFPVGGGPATVSVGRHHHDYPAADIAAPHGAPLYALSNGVVTNAWQSDARCGIGFTMRASDGIVWTYCHLSYLEPGVAVGAVLSAGQPVGLVGSTGYSTGPHLHLQMQPASSYPQEHAWFQSFAGVGFRWQDEAPPAAPRGDVFAPSATVEEEPDVVLFTR